MRVDYTTLIFIPEENLVIVSVLIFVFVAELSSVTMARLRRARNKRVDWITAVEKWDMLELKPHNWKLEDK